MHQYMIRDGKLELTVFMRSNDVWKGLTYDFFNFTTMQHYVAAQLNVPPGPYHHMVGSMHLYVSDHYGATETLNELTRVKRDTPTKFHPLNGGPRFQPLLDMAPQNLKTALRRLVESREPADAVLQDGDYYPSVMNPLYRVLLRKFRPQMPLADPWDLLVRRFEEKP